MWPWLLQRFSAVFALVLIAAHYVVPFNRRIQILLIAFVLFHAALGIRVILLDLGLPRRHEKTALVVLVGLAALLAGAEAAWIQ